MISVWIEQAGATWFGVACHDDRLVATATGSTRGRARDFVLASLPRGAEHRIADEGSAYARRVVEMLVKLEAGVWECPEFDLCPDCVGEPVASIARAASAIPRGYAATYGGIAAAASTEARVVGNIMAANPLYPLIPCHRVVGADLALVGYTGSQGPPALRAKLARLRAEARGYSGSRTVDTPLGPATLLVFPVEQVIAKAMEDGVDSSGEQLPLW